MSACIPPTSGPKINGLITREKSPATVNLDRCSDACKHSIVDDDVRRSCRAAGQDADRYIADGRVNERDGANALTRQAAVATDVKGNGAAADLDVLPIEAPVPNHLYRRDAVGECESTCGVLLRPDPPPDGTAIEREIRDEASRAVLGEDADMGDIFASCGHIEN